MDELQAAQELLLKRRKALGLDENGNRPGQPKRLGDVLDVIANSAPSPSSDRPLFAIPDFLFDREKATHTCRFCGAVLEPTPFELKGRQAWAPKRCACEDAETERLEQERARAEQEERVRVYTRAFPLKDMGDLAGATLESFEERPGTEMPLQFTRRYMTGLPKPEMSSLVLLGDVGNGKSRLAAAIVTEARRQGMAVAWVHTPGWLRALGAMESDRRERLLDLATNADLLVMDELGAGKLTQSRADWLLSVLDTRYRRKAPMVITTNKSMDELGRALTPVEEIEADGDVLSGARLVDRLLEVAWFVENTATSYRMELAQRRLQTLTGGN